MNYDFQTVPDRSRDGAAKWLAAPTATAGAPPLSVADMELAIAPEIAGALSRLALHTVPGYTAPTPEYFRAVCRWMKTRHDWDVLPEWITPTPGVVYALGKLVAALTRPDDCVLILPPVYYPFDRAALLNGRRILYSPLTEDRGRWEMDFEDIERKTADPACSLLIFCSPHNPVGRVWSREELERLCAICEKNKVFLLSDEIHSDLILPGHTHTPLPMVSDWAKGHCAVCTAPSKTFNLAGLQCSNIIIPDPDARRAFQLEIELDLLRELNIFAYTACQTAYDQGGPWLDEFLQLLARNAALATDWFRQNFPTLTVAPLEGTYLLWVDLRPLGLDHKALEAFMTQKAKLFLDEGFLFGKEGRGFERFNLACPTPVLEAALERFRTAWEEAAHREPAPLPELPPAFRQEGLILFLRDPGCPVGKKTLDALAADYKKAEAAYGALTVVLPCEQQALFPPFPVIYDPRGELYTRFGAFEADSPASLLASDPLYTDASHADRMALVRALLAAQKQLRRPLQLPVLLHLGKDGRVLYRFDGQSLTDLPILSAYHRSVTVSLP